VQSKIFLDDPNRIGAGIVTAGFFHAESLAWHASC
jgi:hypothetical protein